jgi:hypothetical protein
VIIRRGAAPVSCFLWVRGYFTSFCQNAITRRLTVHPAYDRFNSNDARKEFANVALGLRTTFELKRFGILGVVVDREEVKDSSAVALVSYGMKRMQPPAESNLQFYRAAYLIR